MKEIKVTCDECSTEINYENVVEVWVKPRESGNIVKLCRHELCDECSKKFLDYIAKWKE